MKTTDKRNLESAHVQFLKDLKILNGLPEQDFDEIAQIAAQVCGTPIALITMIDESQEWLKANVGLTMKTLATGWPFTSHTLLQKNVLVVNDTTSDDRFCDSPLVQGQPLIKFYAGTPILSPGGFAIGTLCVIDTRSRILDSHQIQTLKLLAHQIQRHIEQRVQLFEMNALNEQLKLSQTAIENLAEGIITKNAAGDILDFNQAALDILGVTADELSGKASLPSYWKAISEDGEAISAENRPSQLALRTGQKQSSQIMGVAQPHSEIRWIHIRSTPFFVGDSTQPTHSVTSFSDITELKDTQKTLEKKESDLQRILDGVPAMIGHWSRDLLNLQANKAYLEYFGQKPEEMKGKHIKSLLGPEVFAKNLPYINAALEGKKQTFERELLLPDGSSRHTLATYLPVVQDGVPDGFFVIVTDISEIKGLENQRRELESKMIESSRMSTLGEMAGGIAHEVNNPLTIIKGKASQLKKTIKPENARDEELLKGLTVIENTVDRISNTIRGLRAFSRNAENDPFVETDVSTIIEDTLVLCQERFKHSEIDLQISIVGNVTFACRPTQISQVLMNLLDNAHYAVKFLPEKWVRIAVSSSASRFQISVTDSGRGLSEAIIGKVMQPFFTTKEVGAGTGLGLSISKGIIESHGGTLLYDRSSANTCFVIDLPRTQSMRSS